MNENTKLIFNQLGKALDRLSEVVQLSSLQDRLSVDGTIQRFEFTFELWWKALKKLLFEEFGIEVASPKKALEQAYMNKILDNEKFWIEMLRDRNLTFHTYEEALATEIYKRIEIYLPELQRVFY